MMIKHFKYPDKANLNLILGPLLCLVVVWVLYFSAGHFLIRFLYEGRGVPLLNQIIAGRGVHPLQFYYDIADRYFLKALLFVLAVMTPVMLVPVVSMLRNKKTVYLPVIFVLFLISVAVRMPYINRPLSDHHEWVTAHTMLVLNNWDSQGGWKHRFCLLTTYPAPADKFIPNLYGRMMDRERNGYYMSFPPFAVIFPYIIFKALFIPITVLNIQIFNLMFHCISAYFVYWILCFALNENDDNRFAAFLGSVYFIFLPANLWFYSNIYSWDIFWHYLWIIGIFQVLRISRDISRGGASSMSFLLLGVNIFFMIYSEYTGVHFAVSVLLFAALNLKKSGSYKRLMAYAAVPAVLAVLLVVAQYSSVNGFSGLVNYFHGLDAGYKFQGLTDVKKIIKHYSAAFQAIWIPIVVALLALIKKEGFKCFNRMNADEWALLYFCSFPIVTDLFILPNRTAGHDFRSLKAALLFIAILAMAVHRLSLLKHMGRWVRSALCMAVGMSLIVSWGAYKKVYTASGDPDRFLRIGRVIQQEASAEEVVFLVAEMGINPPIVFHAQRNMLSIKEPEEALEWLQQFNRPKGIIFYVNKDYTVSKIQRVINPSDLLSVKPAT